MGMGISKPIQLSPLPGISGNSGAALATETGSQGGSKLIDMLSGD
jgi:filamentous hemagglutinin